MMRGSFDDYRKERDQLAMPSQHSYFNFDSDSLTLEVLHFAKYHPESS